MYNLAQSPSPADLTEPGVYGTPRNINIHLDLNKNVSSFDTAPKCLVLFRNAQTKFDKITMQQEALKLGMSLPGYPRPIWPISILLTSQKWYKLLSRPALVMAVSNIIHASH